MEDSLHPLETLWERLLSRNAELIRSAFEKLKPEEQQIVLDHLERMSSEPGWHPEQRHSAERALEAISDQKASQ